MCSVCHLLSIPFSIFSPAAGLQLLHRQCSGCLNPSPNLAGSSCPPCPPAPGSGILSPSGGSHLSRAGSVARETQKHPREAVEGAVSLSLLLQGYWCPQRSPGAVSAAPWQLPGSFHVPLSCRAPSPSLHTQNLHLVFLPSFSPCLVLPFLFISGTSSQALT